MTELHMTAGGCGSCTPYFWKKTGPFVISSYLCFDSYELHENLQKYIGGVACCEYGINVNDSFAILC